MDLRPSDVVTSAFAHGAISSDPKVLFHFKTGSYYVASASLELCVDQVALELRYPPAVASWILGYHYGRFKKLLLLF